MDIQGIINEDLIQQAVQETVIDGNGDEAFDKDLFLRVFLSQLQNQSPFDPADTNEMAQQQAILAQTEQSARQTEAVEGISDSLSENFAALNEKLADIKDILEN